MKKGCVYVCDYVIFGIGTYKKCVFRFEKGYKHIIHQVAQKHTAGVHGKNNI